MWSNKTLPIDLITDYVRCTYDLQHDFKLEAFRDSLSDGQINSKLWLIENLKFLNASQQFCFSNKRIGVFGGWVGILCRFLFEYLDESLEIDNIDIDPSLSNINYTLNHKYGNRFRFKNEDMFNLDYSKNVYDIYINTSGEHVKPLSRWIENIPKDKLVVIQSNNYFSHDQHINCVKDIDELVDKVNEAKNLKRIISSDTLKLPIYSRFMVIGTT